MKHFELEAHGLPTVDEIADRIVVCHYLQYPLFPDPVKIASNIFRLQAIQLPEAGRAVTPAPPNKELGEKNECEN